MAGDPLYVIYLLSAAPGDKVRAVCDRLDAATLDRIAEAATKFDRANKGGPWLDEALNAAGLRHVVLIRQKPSDRRFEVPPAIGVSFEPLELNERDPRLTHLLAPEAASEPALPRSADRDLHQAGRRVRIRRFVTRYFTLLFLAFQCFIQGSRILNGQQIRPIGLLAIGLVGAGVVVSLLGYSSKQPPVWFIAPGCVILRRAQFANPAQRLEIRTALNSRLVISAPDSARRPSWVASLGDVHTPLHAEVTELEAQALVAAWTSPLPPPTAELLAGCC